MTLERPKTYRTHDVAAGRNVTKLNGELRTPITTVLNLSSPEATTLVYALG